jgi:hypothetical protein
VKQTNDVFVCAAEFYSPRHQDTVWLVTPYPFGSDAVIHYERLVERLCLRRRPRAKWKIWPYPFTAPDRKALFAFCREVD